MDYRSEFNAHEEPTDLFPDWGEQPSTKTQVASAPTVSSRFGQSIGLTDVLGAAAGACVLGSLFLPWIVAETVDQTVTLDATTPYVLGFVAVVWSVLVLFSTRQITRARRRVFSGVLALLAWIDLLYVFGVLSATGVVKMGLRWANSLSDDVDVTVSFGAGFLLHVVAGLIALLASMMSVRTPKSDRSEKRS